MHQPWKMSLGMVLLALWAGGLSGCNLDSKDAVPEPRADQNMTAAAGPGAAYEEGSASRIAPPGGKMQAVEGSSSDIEGHPTLDPDQRVTDRKILIPAAVEGKWKSVKLFVRNKQDEEQSRMRTVDLGSSFTLEGTGLKVTVGPFLPNFVMDTSAYTSVGNELVNPAVRLVVKEGDKTVFEGWAFAKYPGMYAFEHEMYSLQLMDFIPVEVS